MRQATSWFTIAACTLALLAASAAPAADAAPRAVGCPAAYRPFIKSLTVLEGYLDVGVTFNQYESYLTKAQIAYNQLPVSQASLPCLNNVGIPGEQALNDYILAGNSWKGCISRVYSGLTTSCTDTGSPGEGSRQIFWSRAHAAVSRAVNNLG